MIRILTHLGGMLLLVIAAASPARPAHADLYGASSEYKKGDYAHAFPDYLALAELGQPVAQLNVAVMYADGQGTTQSDIHAYAWAMLAAENGEATAAKLANTIRPNLAPGSEQIAGWFTAPYTPGALSLRLMPVHLATAEVAAQHRQWNRECYPVKAYEWVYPDDARRQSIEGQVFVAFTLMPDGSARIPRIILDVPQGVFGDATRESVLRDDFAPLPAGSSPIHCVNFYRFTVGKSAYEYPKLPPYVKQIHQQATAGDPQSQLLYGMLLVGLPQLKQSSNAGLPWFLKAAQAGLPLAQFQVGYSLLTGIDCKGDDGKARRWLLMAADQNEPNAEVALATLAMRGLPGSGDVVQARSWLEKAAAQGNQDGELYLSALLAAAPDPRVRDPGRALDLLEKGSDHLWVDPTAFEIRAAAQGAKGDFVHAVKSEKKAISLAQLLRWNLSPLQARLAVYQAGKPWYGNLLDY
jgi:uncharacterized protein